MSPLILLALFFAQDTAPRKCTISGAVVDAVTGQPLGKAEVWLDTAGEEHFKPAVTGVTDAKGNFTIDGVDPGHYFITGSRNGYLDTYYGARRPGGGRIAIALEAGQELKDVALKLFPYSVVAGTVRDADGEPLSGASVTLWSVQFEPDGQRFSQAAERDTDDLGQFRISDLEPGKYYLRAELETRGALVDSYYPGVQDPDPATMVEVGLGARVTGLDIAMPRPRGFHVTVRIAAPPGLNLGCWLSASRDEHAYSGSLFRDLTPTRGPYGEFVFDRVPAGAYTLRAFASQPPNGGMIAYSASQRLEVTDGDIGDLRIALAAGAAIDAHYAMEGDRKTPLKSAALRFSGGQEANFAEDRRLSTTLVAGHYVVEFKGLPPGVYVKGIRSDSSDVLREGLTVSGGGAIPLEIALSDDAGALDGVALDRDEKPVPGATVVLIPEARFRQRSDRFYTATTDQYGRFQLKDLAPGGYIALAWDDVKPNSWFDPDFLRPLESTAAAVTIKPNGHDTLSPHVQAAK